MEDFIFFYHSYQGGNSHRHMEESRGEREISRLNMESRPTQPELSAREEKIAEYRENSENSQALRE